MPVEAPQTATAPPVSNPKYFSADEKRLNSQPNRIVSNTPATTTFVVNNLTGGMVPVLYAEINNPII